MPSKAGSSPVSTIKGKVAIDLPFVADFISDLAFHW